MKFIRHRSNWILIVVCLVLFVIQRRSSTIYRTSKEIFVTLDQIQRFPSLEEKIDFNLSSWINEFHIGHLFDYYWFHTGGYQWHLQQMLYRVTQSNWSSIIVEHDRKNIREFIYEYPEHGVIIDTAPDPFPLVFPPLPRTSYSLKETCERFQLTNRWYPCSTRSERILPLRHQSHVTYALYNVYLPMLPSTEKTIVHYDEIIYLFDSPLESINETFFVRQILPRLIRLLALAPSSASILFPYSKVHGRYVQQYINILIQRGILLDRKRFIKWNTDLIYHAHVVYFTSSPRSDLLLLHQVLIGSPPMNSPQRQELIIVVRNRISQQTYSELIQTIDQFEFPEEKNYVHIYEYEERSYSVKHINEIFPQALIVIGMSSDILSHIVWCLPGTHLIEIGDQHLTSDFYEISLQLRLNYWFTMTNQSNQIDITDFRQLFLQLLSSIV